MNAFIAGTDTAVGKTAVTCGLLRILKSRGIRAAGMKPIAAGTDLRNLNEDVEALTDASWPGLAVADLNSYLFRAPTAPHIAARLEHRLIEWPPLEAAFRSLTDVAEIVLVEGIGGWRIPLSDSLSAADLVKRWQLPVILVAGIRLGALNHTLLTVEAILRDGCQLAGWVANVLDPTYAYANPIIEAIETRVPAPCLGQIPCMSVVTASAFDQHLREVARVFDGVQ